MRKLYHEALTEMGNAFEHLEKQVPAPQKIDWGNKGYVFRYKEKSIEQVLIQKLARMISGLRAVDILLFSGMLQEQAALHRVLDEINEDILFLVYGLIEGQITQRHKQYLLAFYSETFSDPNNSLARIKKPNSVPRAKIRSYINSKLIKDQNPSLASDVGESISTVYSGFIHASSSQIMDMYCGNPPRFHIYGLRGTPRMEEYIDDAWNYFYRGLLSVCSIAKAFEDEQLVNVVYEYIDKFENASGTTYMKKAKE